MSGINTQYAQIRVLDTSVSPNAYVDIACVTDFQGPSGSRAVIDTTCLDSDGKEKQMGIPDYGQLNLNIIFSTAPSDNHVVSSVSLWENFKNAGRQTFRIIIPESPELHWQFLAYVNGFQVTAAVDEVFRAAVSLEIDGAVTDNFT